MYATPYSNLSSSDFGPAKSSWIPHNRIFRMIRRQDSLLALLIVHRTTKLCSKLEAPILFKKSSLVHAKVLISMAGGKY